MPVRVTCLTGRVLLVSKTDTHEQNQDKDNQKTPNHCRHASDQRHPQPGCPVTRPGSVGLGREEGACMGHLGLSVEGSHRVTH